MKKNLKLVLALILAAMMIISSISAIAAAGDLDVNSTLTVSGLDEGDTVKYYQVLQWQLDDAEHNGGWIWGTGVDADDLEDTTTIAAIAGSKDGTGAITGAIAGDLAANLGTEMTPAGTVSDGIWTVEGVPAGLYMVIVTPAKAGTIYNPIFVAANFVGTNETPDTSNSWIVTSDKSYSDKAMAKKSSIPLDKTAKGNDKSDEANGNDLADGAYTTDIGEEIEFTVTTKIPKFGSNYTDPVFQLHDVLKGLKLKAAPVVKAGETTLTEGDDKDYKLTNGAADDTEYTIKFTKTYLDSVAADGQEITVTYTGIVTDTAEKIVNQDKNTVDLIFSTTPDDTKGAGLLRDETNHFTFSIDADLLGGGEGDDSSTEAIKIGVDQEGNPIMSEKTYKWNGGKTHSALAGAEFELLDASGNSFSPKKTAISDETGRINFKGLDAGKYKLKETKAPAGFIKMQDTVDVEIKAVITEEVEVKEEVDNDGTPVKVTYKTNRLDSYTVTINGAETSYTIVNSQVEASKAKRNPSSSDSELANTKGVELPSTGGMGTTIFYVGGSILVLAAAILLVTKRRMGVED